jgi:hypothetical protein
VISFFEEMSGKLSRVSRLWAAELAAHNPAVVVAGATIGAGP